MKLLVKYEHPFACVKPPSIVGDAGFNVVCAEDARVIPGVVSKISLGFSMAVPAGTFCTMIARSSAISKGLFVLSSLIDEGYRGPMFAFVFNMTADPVDVKIGDMIAQLVLLPNLALGVEVEQVKELPTSDRGANGFGSTGTEHAPISAIKEVAPEVAMGVSVDVEDLYHAPLPEGAIVPMHIPVTPPIPVDRSIEIYGQAAAIADVCRMDLEMNKGRLMAEAKLLNKPSVRIRELFGPGGPWYRYDYRGKQGSCPVPQQVRQMWVRMEAQFLAAKPAKMNEDGSAYV